MASDLYVAPSEVHISFLPYSLWIDTLHSRHLLVRGVERSGLRRAHSGTVARRLFRRPLNTMSLVARLCGVH